MELWITVKEHPDYEVSSEGRVRNKKTGRFLRPSLNRPQGYCRVVLDGQRYYVHRLVADAFYDGDHRGRDVHHIDGDCQNNELSNLKWCTRSEVIQNAFDTGTKYPAVVKVVRCKYCRHRYEDDFCEGRSDDFFCADGER